MAAYYKDKPKEMQEDPPYWFVTGYLKVEFLKPTPIDKPVQLRARIQEFYERKALVTCTLYSEGSECARAEVLAVRVPAGKGKKSIKQ